MDNSLLQTNNTIYSANQMIRTEQVDDHIDIIYQKLRGECRGQSDKFDKEFSDIVISWPSRSSSYRQIRNHTITHRETSPNVKAQGKLFQRLSSHVKLNRHPQDMSKLRGNSKGSIQLKRINNGEKMAQKVPAKIKFKYDPTATALAREKEAINKLSPILPKLKNDQKPHPTTSQLSQKSLSSGFYEQYFGQFEFVYPKETLEKTQKETQEKLHKPKIERKKTPPLITPPIADLRELIKNLHKKKK